MFINYVYEIDMRDWYVKVERNASMSIVYQVINVGDKGCYAVHSYAMHIRFIHKYISHKLQRVVPVSIEYASIK